MSAFFLGHPKETDLALFSGGELGPLARWRIERHLESCASCQSLVSEFFHLESELSSLADVPSVDWNRLAESIESRAVEARTSGGVSEPRPAVPAWGMGLAAACAAAVVAVGLWNADFRSNEPASEEAARAAAPTREKSTVADELSRQEAAEPEAPAEASEADSAAEPPAASSPEPTAAPEATQPSTLRAAEQAASEAPRAEAERQRAFADADERAESRALSGDTAAPPPPAAPAVSRAAETESFRALPAQAEVVQDPARQALRRALGADGRSGLERAVEALAAREPALTPQEAGWLELYRERGLDGLITALTGQP